MKATVETITPEVKKIAKEKAIGMPLGTYSSKKIPCGRVLYITNSILKNYEKEIIVEPKKIKEN